MRSGQIDWLVTDEVPRLLRVVRLDDHAHDLDKLLASKNGTHEELVDLLGECSDQCNRVASVERDIEIANKADWLGTMLVHLMHSESQGCSPQTAANHAGRAMQIAALQLGVAFREHRCDA